MITIQEFKDFIELKLEEAKATLLFMNSLQPIFAYALNDKVETINLTITEEDREKEIELIRNICKSPSVQYAAILCDCLTYSNEDESQMKAIVGRDLNGVEGSVDSVMVFLYTRNQTSVRTLPYKKREEQDYWFSDKGWEDVPKSSLGQNFIRAVSKVFPGVSGEVPRFANPFQA
jgi:hypothetical protein